MNSASSSKKGGIFTKISSVLYGASWPILGRWSRKALKHQSSKVTWETLVESSQYKARERQKFRIVLRLRQHLWHKGMQTLRSSTRIMDKGGWRKVAQEEKEGWSENNHYFSESQSRYGINKPGQQYESYETYTEGESDAATKQIEREDSGEFSRTWGKDAT